MTEAVFGQQKETRHASLFRGTGIGCGLMATREKATIVLRRFDPKKLSILQYKLTSEVRLGAFPDHPNPLSPSGDSLCLISDTATTYRPQRS